MTKPMSPGRRAEMLSNWHAYRDSADTAAAVMIIGYEMYRNLLRGRYRDVGFRNLDIFKETLQWPGRVLCSVI